MAQHRGSATSRSPAPPRTPRPSAPPLLLPLLLLLSPLPAEAGLYSASDQVLLPDPDGIDALLGNSSRALLLEFYASWCGHCVGFAPVWKRLARDITEWKPAVDLAALDCAEEINRPTCIRFGVNRYPTIKFFHAYSKPGSKGELVEGVSSDVKGLRQQVIDLLESHGHTWPPACPPLEPASEAEIDNYWETTNGGYLALIFETADSYVGREVTLDLLQYENIAVRRVLNTEQGLVSKMAVTDFPSCYLYYANGTFARLNVHVEARTFYSYVLQRLPTVRRAGKPQQGTVTLVANATNQEWREFNRRRVYMADLESALHYSLRMEVAGHPQISTDSLQALKRYISVLAKYFPGRPIVMNLLRYLDSWLQGITEPEISYSSLLDVLDNKMEVPRAALPSEVKWVGCQGSQPQFRGYPCSVWTLFHVLTVQATANRTAKSDPLEVPQALIGYVKNFFGCRECASHFENMAQESMQQVKSLASSVLWLWSRHNRVNNRLAGALSEDPQFPKIQWPPPEQCPGCHDVKRGEHTWKQEPVLYFLKEYFSAQRILPDYLEEEAVLLDKQAAQRAAAEAGGGGRRKGRGAPEEGEEEEEGEQQLAGEEEDGEDVDEQGEGEATAEAAPEMEAGDAGRHWEDVGPARIRRPSIVGLRLREERGSEDIVDLDSFVNQHYKIKALRAAADAAHRREEEEEEAEQGPSLQGQPEEPADYVAVRKRLQKRGLAGKYMGLEEADTEPQGKRWIFLLNVGFSRLDISLCVLLYLLSSLCLMAMYLYFKMRLRLRRGKQALP
ncbi:sulfhydryl oxidase 1 [Amia ocellicauda]|uniref:sulfhydryl oxidase 1 n=1 Tax=Amia ocellicauda TaxID=2972642 RepID=UPI003464DE5F